MLNIQILKKSGNEKSFNWNTTCWDLQVESDFGADGEGSIQVNRGVLATQDGQLSYRSFQIFGANDPSICELYFIVSREVRKQFFKCLTWMQ